MQTTNKTACFTKYSPSAETTPLIKHLSTKPSNKRQQSTAPQTTRHQHAHAISGVESIFLNVLLQELCSFHHVPLLHRVDEVVRPDDHQALVAHAQHLQGSAAQKMIQNSISKDQMACGKAAPSQNQEKDRQHWHHQIISKVRRSKARQTRTHLCHVRKPSGTCVVRCVLAVAVQMLDFRAVVNE